MAESRSGLTQALDDDQRHLGKRMDRSVLEKLGKYARQGPAILHHVRNAGRMAEVMMFYLPCTVHIPANAHPGDVEKRIGRSLQAASRGLVMGTGKHGLMR